MRYLWITVLILFVAGCAHAPRDKGLPRTKQIVDFSQKEPISAEITGYGSFTGEPRANNRSIAKDSIEEIENEKVLAVDYTLGGWRNDQVYAGIWLNINNTVLRKNWLAVGLELKPSNETGPIEKIALKAQFSNYPAESYYSLTSGEWQFCVLPTNWEAVGFASPTQFYKQLAIVLQNKVTTPESGRIFIRRIFLLATPKDIPDKIRKKSITIVNPLPNLPS